MDNQELLKNTEKWLKLMGIDGLPNQYTQNYLQWKTHKENLQKQGCLENIIYRFYDGIPNYKKLTQEVAYLQSFTRTFDKLSILKMMMDKKQRGITTIIKPTKQEAENSYDDFGYVNLNNDISTGEYTRLFEDYCKKIGKKFPTQKQKQEALEMLMKGTYAWDYGVLEDYLHQKIKEWKTKQK